MRICRLIVLFAVSAGTAARAQTLAERVPADAVAYLGWKGADSADNGYAGSHLQAVIDASGFAQIRDQVIPQVMKKITAKSSDNGEGALAAKTTLNILWRHPSAAFFAGMTKDPNGKDTPKMGLICQAGTDSDALMTIFNAGVHGPDAAPMARAFVSGDCTVFLIGYDTDNVIPGAADQAKSLAENADFTRMMVDASKSSLVAFYLNTTGAISIIDDAVANGAGDEQTKAIWPKVRDASGLMGLRHAAITAGFDGKDWRSQTFVDAPAPRTGLLTVVEPTLMDAALLSRIPTTATTCMLEQFNFGGLIQELRSIAVSTDPMAGDMFDKGMGVAQMMIGRSLQHDILEPLGSQWAIYTDDSIPPALNSTTKPAMADSNVVVVNKLIDPAKALQGWTLLSYAISNASGGYIHKQHLPVTMSMTKNGEESVFTIVTPYVQPSWTIHDGYMYFGFSQAGVVAAANHPSGPPINEQPAMVELTNQLARDVQVTGFAYSNLPKSVPAAYPAIEQATQKLVVLAKQNSITLPDRILPPLDKVLPELNPAMTVSWADASGYHTRSSSPLPGVSASPETLIVGGGAISATILLPSLNRARETANRVKCASDERQMGQALLLYANEHKGNYPPTIVEMITDEELLPEVFLCPSSNTSLPKNKNQMSPADLAAWTEKHTDYVYVGKGMTTMAGANDIAIYEKPDDHGKDGMNILFGDGHVEFVTMANAVRMIRAQNKTVPGVMLPMPEMQDVPAE